jgi:hypothetical protein
MQDEQTRSRQKTAVTPHLSAETVALQVQTKTVIGAVKGRITRKKGWETYQKLIFLSEIRSVSISATQIQPYTMYTNRLSDINLPKYINLNQTFDGCAALKRRLRCKRSDSRSSIAISSFQMALTLTIGQITKHSERQGKHR